jgi:hypothetical protein
MLGFNSLRDNPISNALLGHQPPMQPGVGTTSTHDLHKDPATGMYYDPTTGTTFTDQYGQHPVTDPNVAQQVAANFNSSRQFLTNLANVQGQEGQLAGNLRSLIQGGQPSVAEMGVQRDMNNIAQQQMSGAAGVSGAGSPLAQLLANRNTANAQIQAAGAGGIARANELTGARGALSQLLGGMAGQNLAGAGEFAGLASSGQAGQQGMDAATAKANEDFALKLGTAVLGGGAGAGSAPGAGGAGGKSAVGYSQGLPLGAGGI